MHLLRLKSHNFDPRRPDYGTVTITCAAEDKQVHLKVADRHIDRIIACDEREMQFATLQNRAVPAV